MIAPDPKHCPLCGQPNKCGVAQGRDVCWCFTRLIPEEVLAKISVDTQQLTCVCETCALGLRKSGDVETPEAARQSGKKG